MINHRTARVTIVALAVASLGIAACSTNSNSDTTTPAASPTMSSAPLWAPPGTADLSAQTADELQAAIDKWVDQGSLKGMTAAVVTPGRGVVRGCRRRRCRHPVAARLGPVAPEHLQDLHRR